MGVEVLNAYLVYSDDLPPEAIFNPDIDPCEIVFAKSKGQARGVFTKFWGLPFVAKLHIRIVERDVYKFEGHTAEDDDPIWEKVDPDYAAHLKKEFELSMRGESDD